MAKRKSEDRPGFMVYFKEFNPVFSSLDYEEAGVLFKALLAYADTGETAPFDNRMLGVLFEVLSAKIDFDKEHYKEICETQSRNAKSRWSKEKGPDVPENADACGGIPSDADDANTNNNTNTNTSTNTNTNTNTKTSTNAKKTRHKYGSYKNVLLSDDELAKLKEEFPLDYSGRIEALSEYVESTGKSYKNHLATLRVWAKKDRGKPNSSAKVRQDLDDPLPF